MKNLSPVTAILALLLASSAATPLLAEAGTQEVEAPAKGLLRFPDIHGDQVVFSDAGDLWVAKISGGVAHRITAHPGVELFPKFSPDGTQIAFTAQYDGNEEVYVIPAEGGEPRQLTFYPARGPLPTRWGYDNQVYGWTPDGKSVLFRSYRDEPLLNETRLYTVPVAGGEPIQLPLPRAGAGALSPDGKQVFYSPWSRDFRAWKMYRGGWAQDLWLADLQSRSLVNLTDNPANDRDPIWCDGGLFFTSDRNGPANIFRVDPATKEVSQMTQHARDVEWASGDEQCRIVYTLDGMLRLFDPSNGTDRAIDVQVPAEATNMLPRQVNVSDQIEDALISPDGERVLFDARGDLMVRRLDGPVIQLTHSSDAHDRAPAWSPDGKRVAFISDKSGEEELWVTDSDGNGTPHQVTDGNRTRFYAPVWSPDGKQVALIDKGGKLKAVDVNTGATRDIGETGSWYQRDYQWSPDSRYIAYGAMGPTNYRTVQIWDSRTGETVGVTDPLYDSWNPAWSSDGSLLYFLGDRNFAPQISNIEWDIATDRQAGIYALALKPDGPNPFMPDAKWNKEDVSGKGAKTPKNDVQVDIDFTGLPLRLIAVPVPFDNYYNLVASDTRLTAMVGGPRVFGGPLRSAEKLVAYDIGDQKLRTVVEDAGGYDPASGEQVSLVRSGRSYRVVKLAGDPSPRPVRTDDLVAVIDPPKEWRTIFDEVWRRYRDYFYASNFHGLDWEAIGERYRARLPSVGSRSDLSALISDMLAELNVSHAYITGNEPNPPERGKIGLLGARLEQVGSNYRFDHIFEGDNSIPLYRSPLTEPGIDVHEGNWLLAVNGSPVSDQVNPYTLLRDTAGQLVTLRVASSPEGKDARDVTIRALDSDRDLMYLEQVEKARETVDRLSGGRIGYIQVPNMGADGIREFLRSYYGQIRKDGLIIDVRGNSGGQVSPLIMERLLRKRVHTGYITGMRYPQSYPWGGLGQHFTGEMAMLINESTMSDGDTIAWTFRETGRGPLIGTRTWGGTVGTGDTGPLLDGTSTNVPQYALADASGHYVVEPEGGVTPDIEVGYDAEMFAEGRDAQLEAAVATLLQTIKGHPGQLPAQPAPPVRNHPLEIKR